MQNLLLRYIVDSFNIGQMKILKLPLNLLLLVTLSSVAACCPSNLNFDYSSCNFYISFKESACQNFTFDHCSWEECAVYSSRRVGNVTTMYCSLYKTLNDSGWQSCTNRCCQQGVVYNQTAESMSACQNYLNERNKTRMSIIGIVIGSIVGSILMVFLMCMYFRREEAKTVCRNVCERWKQWPCFRRQIETDEVKT